MFCTYRFSSSSNTSAPDPPISERDYGDEDSEVEFEEEQEAEAITTETTTITTTNQVF
jgi:hypothetical protein